MSMGYIILGNGQCVKTFLQLGNQSGSLEKS
jgi:hypothetical protein